MRSRETQPPARALERGSILFLYRPKSGVAHAQSADDLERIYLMLIPDGRERHKARIFSLSGRGLPTLERGEGASALAEEVDPDPRVALDDLQDDATASAPPGRGPRPWVRAAGEGRYVIALRGADTHLAYALARPEPPGEVQQALQIGARGDLLISVQAPAAQPGRRPLYPSRLASRLDGYDQVPAEPSDFLDYQYARAILLAVDSRPEQELGLRLEPGAQNQGQRQAHQMLRKQERRASQEGVALLEPMQEGHWA